MAPQHPLNIFLGTIGSPAWLTSRSSSEVNLSGSDAAPQQRFQRDQLHYWIPDTASISIAATAIFVTFGIIRTTRSNSGGGGAPNTITAVTATTLPPQPLLRRAPWPKPLH
ncbi:hypothetical protein F5X99DRAFT_404211 [Biscogniauxia marginata]|nr:hypothetical protein F5X99DRAFT_404211 [Biscogniauxia marginata]